MLTRIQLSVLFALAAGALGCASGGSSGDGSSTLPEEEAAKSGAELPLEETGQGGMIGGGCAVTLCAAGTNCVERGDGTAECVPLINDDPCAVVRCAAGTHCEAKQVQCVRAPCPPIAECVPDAAGAKCGENTCGAGQFCCNESCGICAPIDGACTQQFCEPKQ